MLENDLSSLFGFFLSSNVLCVIVVHLFDLVSVVEIRCFHVNKGLVFIIESYLRSMLSLSCSFLQFPGVLEFLVLIDLLPLRCGEERSLPVLSLLIN